MTAATTAAGLRAALDEHLGALRAKDAERFAATLGTDVVVVDGKGALVRGTRGGAALAPRVVRLRRPVDVRLRGRARARSRPGLALIDVTYRHSTDAAPARFLLALVFERDAAGAWKFVYDQNTPLS